YPLEMGFINNFILKKRVGSRIYTAEISHVLQIAVDRCDMWVGTGIVSAWKAAIDVSKPFVVVLRTCALEQTVIVDTGMLYVLMDVMIYTEDEQPFISLFPWKLLIQYDIAHQILITGFHF
ncbi:hypothetical protein ACJX0J_020248, partial [Zea mays]